jgi:serine protease Do
MTKNLIKSVLVLIFICFCNSCLVEGPPSPVIEPIRVDPTQVASISFKQAIIRIPAGTKIGTDYTQPNEPNLLWQTSISVGEQIFNEVVIEELNKANHNVVGSTKLLFGNDDSWKANYLLGARITDIRYDIYSYLRMRIEASVTVQWELFDIAERKVVYAQQTMGSTQSQDNSGTACIVEAFRDATKKLLATTEFINNLVISKPIFHKIPVDGRIKIERIVLPIFRTEPDLVSRATESVVTIKTERGHGSGVIISQEGYLITNYHVIGETNIIDVILSSGLILKAEVLRIDQGYDVALLKMNGSGFKALPAGEAESIRVGEEIFAIGTPVLLDFSQSVSKGVISGTRRQKDDLGREYIQADISINPGNSGGPIINMKGEILGIVSRRPEKTADDRVVLGLALCIPIDIVLEKLAISR